MVIHKAGKAAMYCSKRCLRLCNRKRNVTPSYLPRWSRYGPGTATLPGQRDSLLCFSQTRLTPPIVS